MPKPISSRITGKLGILALFFLLSLNHLHPLLKSFFSKLPYASNGDVRLTLAILFSNVQKLGFLQFGQLYHLPFLFPLSHTLTIGFPLFGPSILLLPFFMFGSPNIYPLYNGLVIFAYLSAGYGAFLFFRELQESETVAVITAGLYILLPFRVYNVPHLNLLLNFPIPFSLYFLLRYLKAGRNRDLLLFNAFLLGQFLFDLSHGFFLAVSLAILVLIFVLIQRPLPLRRLIGLALSLLPTMAVVLLIHLPFLQKGAALSHYSPSFDPGQYHQALSFYANKSSLLLWLNRLWDPWPYFPGFSVVFFYFFAFSHYARELRDRILLWLMTGAYAVPGLIAVIFFEKRSLARIDSLSAIGIVAFFISLTALVFSLRKKLPLALKLVSLFLLALTFITFQPFPRIFDLFNALARFLPFLHRSRGLRTSYILPLAILGIFAFGFKAFLEKRQGKKIILAAAALLLLAEHLRWPVEMARLPEPDAAAMQVYAMANAYPPHFGLLELPFVPTSSNMYSLFTRYHNKHTYHGHYLTYDDPLRLEDEVGLRVERGFSGLGDPGLLERLKANGLYLIMISDSFIRRVYDGDVSAAWHQVRQSARAGLASGLFREVKEERHALLIVLDDSRSGRDITYPIPYFALAGRKTVRFLVRAQVPTRGGIYFNGRRIVDQGFSPAGQQVALPLHSALLSQQVNRIRIVSEQPVTAANWRIE